jgi:hypothetical protein
MWAFVLKSLFFESVAIYQVLEMERDAYFRT